MIKMLHQQSDEHSLYSETVFQNKLPGLLLGCDEQKKKRPITGGRQCVHEGLKRKALQRIHYYSDAQPNSKSFEH